jgi:hypothetical protein
MLMFINLRMSRVAGLVMLSLVLLPGCGGGSGPVMYAAKGKVTYQSKPVPDANVMFAPENGAPAMGKTDSSGYFSLSTNGQSGAMPGKGIWTITAFEPVELPPPISADEAGKLAAQGKLPIVVGKSIIPEKYGTTITSGLNYEVTTTSSKNNFDIALTD